MQAGGKFAPSEVPGGLALRSARDFTVATRLQAADCTIELKISILS